MRTFSYNFDEREAIISVFLLGEKICEARFPTQGSAHKFWKHDLNWQLGLIAKDSLTESEEAAVLELLKDVPNDQ